MCHLEILSPSHKHIVFPRCWVQRSKQVCHLKNLHPSLSLIENWLKITSELTLSSVFCFFVFFSPKSIRAHVTLLSGPRDTDRLLRVQPTCKWPQKVSCSVYTVWFSNFERQKNGQCHVQLWTLKVSKVCLNKIKKKADLGEYLGERSSGMNWITTTACTLFIHSLIYLFIPQQGFVADSFFIYNFMPLNHLVDRRSVGGALSVRGNLSGLTDDADRCSETLCYLDSVVQSVIEVPASFIISHRRSNWFLCEGKCHWNIQKEKKTPPD